MITERDQVALDFIELFGVATTHQINRVAYNNIRVCQRRLVAMLKDGVVVRESNLYSKEYLYSTKKPNLKQLRHKLLRNEFYIKIREIADVLSCWVEQPLGAARPDATMIITSKTDKKHYLIAVEIESSNNTINISKYEKMAQSDDVTIPMPLVVYVTDKNIPQTKYFKWVKVSPKLDDLEKILL